jgi:hypothetical protein
MQVKAVAVAKAGTVSSFAPLCKGRLVMQRLALRGWGVLAVVLLLANQAAPAGDVTNTCFARYRGRTQPGRALVTARFVLFEVQPKYRVVWSEARAFPAGKDGGFEVTLGAESKERVGALLTSGRDRYLSIERDEEGLQQTLATGALLQAKSRRPVRIGDPLQGQIAIVCKAARSN